MKKIFLLSILSLLSLPVFAVDIEWLRDNVSKGIQAIQASDYNKVHKIGITMIEKAPDFGYGYYLEAKYLFRSEKYLEAIPYFTKAIKKQTDLAAFEIPLAYYARGICYYLTKDYNNAISDFNIVETYDVDFIINTDRYYIDKSLAYSKIKDYDNAIKCAVKAKQLTNDFMTVYKMNKLIEEYEDSKEKNMNK